ncbi:MAG TPA: phosphate ABC transporter permease PstA [Rhizomicrobium sp.]|jgi:phosphate transport system permease protein|nr:phosphate ABC transporter permease PstA [Rhizomicrobium sp.]
MIVSQGLYLRRRIANNVFIVLSVAAALFGLIWLAFILSALLSQGVAALSPILFTHSTPPPGQPGGLLNAIIGSLLMSVLAVVLGTPIGLFAGTYLAEYGKHTNFAFVVRFVNDILLSAPSIVTGLFIYEIVVLPIGHFSAWAGALSLMVIVIPVVVRTTENMLILVPSGLREAASALGAPMNHVIRAVSWKAAQAGIITGVLLAIARISGETAPLLFTALNNQFLSFNLNAPMASLPAVIFQFALSAYDDQHRLAWAGALLITAAVLAFSIIARLLETKRN